MTPSKDITDFDQEDIFEAVRQVTGGEITESTPDDEHFFFYIDGEGGAEFIDDLLTPEELEDVFNYLNENCEPD